MRRVRSRETTRLGQALVETALSLTIFVTLIFGTVDFGRLIYLHNYANRAADAAARQLSLASQKTSDCTAITDAISSGNAISISIDSTSKWGDSDPRGATFDTSTTPTTPTAGQGLLYLWPAVAASPPTNCDATGTNTRRSGAVVAEITYDFQPWTPFISVLLPNITLTSTSVLQTEY